ncbi:MAG: starch-binding protein [Muribaculaceae bacterium]|nr:starch-binding protein [Muribaculaceae bacterium]
MKKLNIYNLFILLLLPLLGACSKDEIIFDSELPRFETRPGYQLIEAIVPQATSATDEIYIIGEFNGGMDAVGDPRWQLEKAGDTDVKWGIYLNPNDFVAGKTLADGYTFYNVQQGEERGLGDTPVTHRESPAVGGRANVMIYFWEEYFKTVPTPDEIDHDGYVLYVLDNSGFADLTCYVWGDATFFGDWPGVRPTGTVNLNGVTYKYFDTGAANEGLNANFIFSDNGENQLGDFSVTLDKDYYVELTPSGATEITPGSSVQHDGYVVYIYNSIGWESLYLYAWGTEEVFGAWPGIPATGTETINGVTYTYFDLGAANCDAGTDENLIINDGVGGTGGQFDMISGFAMDRDLYYEVSKSGTKEIDPNTFSPGGTVDPEPEPEPEPDGTKYTLFVENNTGWDATYLYAYGDAGEMFGKWPGKAPDGTATVAGVKYDIFYVYGNGESENFIFNNGNGTQLGDITLTLDQDYTLTIDAQGAQLKNKKRNKARK